MEAVACFFFLLLTGLDGRHSLEYYDPVVGSVSSKQGVSLMFVDGTRAVFRLSGI